MEILPFYGSIGASYAPICTSDHTPITGPLACQTSISGVKFDFRDLSTNRIGVVIGTFSILPHLFLHPTYPYTYLVVSLAHLGQI